MKKVLSMLLVTSMVTTLGACSQSNQQPSAADTTTAAVTTAAGAAADTQSETTAAPAAEEMEVIQLKMGTTGPAPADDVYVVSTYFADAVEEISGGKITVEVVGSGALGTTAQHYAQLKEGSLDFFTTAFDTATTMIGGEDFAVVACPYLFRDIDHYQAFLESDLLSEMVAPVEAANSVVYMGSLGFRLPRGLNCTFPVRTVADAANLKVRTPDTASTLRVWEAMGANPMVIAAAELYTSLQSGICDAQENDYKTSYNNGWMEAAPYYMELDYIQQGNVVFMSEITYSSLNEQQIAWIEEALKQAHESYNEDSEKAIADLKDKILADGYEFVEVDIQGFRDKAAEAVETLDGTLWADGLADKIRAIE